MGRLDRQLVWITAAAAALTLASPGRSAVRLYDSAAALGVAAPGLGAIDLSSLTGSVGVYPNDSAVPGLVISTLAPGQQSTALISLGGRIGDNWIGDTLVFAPTAPVSAFGLDVLNELAEPGSRPIDAPITLDVYAGATLLAEFTRTASDRYFGLVSTTPITSVTVFSDCNVDCSSLASQVSDSVASPAPEPGAWTMLLVGFALAGAACRRGAGRGIALSPRA